MLRRTPLLLALVGVILVIAPTSNADIIPPLPACVGAPDATNAPCVAGVTHEGTPIPYDNDTGEGHDAVFASTWTNPPPDGSTWFTWNITDENGDFALTYGDEYSITINTGTVYPGETFARGHDVVVDRTVDGLGHHIVTFTQEVVRMADQGCDGAGVCSANAGRTSSGYLDGWVDNLQYVDNAADRAAMRGFDLSSNIDWISSPLELDFATNSIFLRVANSHYEGPPTPASTTPFVGFAEFKLPYSMLNRLYDVTDPDSMTAAAFSVTGAGAAATTDVVVDHIAHTVHVQLEGLTFSRHKLRIQGTMRPGRPREVHAVRTASPRGKLTFLPAVPHGSKVTKYVARCESAGGHVVTGSNTASPVKVFGLAAGTRYECSVRAKSRWGYSYRAFDTMPRTP